MARTNKYSSLNFNDIYEKKIISNNVSAKSHSSSSSPSLANPSKTILASSRIHGNMLVLSRPSPKPISQPTHQPPPPPPQAAASKPPDQTRFQPDSISLRPLGRTGSGPALSLSSSPLTSPQPDKEFAVSPKPDPFVPPHLRRGFVGREEKPGPEFQKQPGFRSREFGGNRQGNFGSSNLYGEDGRPKSGCGYERMRRGGDPDPMEMYRPGSSG